MPFKDPRSTQHGFQNNDPRFVYGATCTWWESIMRTAADARTGLPCCPHCGGLLLEVPNEEALQVSPEYEAQFPGYTALFAWMRGKCFRDAEAAVHAYELALSAESSTV